MITDDWKNCYGEGWKGILNDAAFAHPAKFSRALIRRIYRHAIVEGWLQDGDSVIDPFGGIAAGAYDAMRFGLHWYGCELEPKFVELGRQNILKWNTEHNANFKKWGSAALLQGDSRRLCETLRTDAECVVSSPPYSVNHAPGRDGNEEREIALPKSDRIGKSGWGNQYGSSLGQLSSMREGDFSASISSPPYSDGLGHDAGHPRLDAKEDGRRLLEGCKRRKAYGLSNGQLAAMPEGQFDASVSSPPYENSMSAATNGIDWSKNSDGKGGTRDFTNEPAQEMRLNMGKKYGDSIGQLGIESGETFWSAAKQIVEQVHAALKPQGKTIWVLKDYVRNRERVPFCERWMLLCESVGFKTLHWHRAWLVEDYGTQQDLLGAHQKNIRERKSFFRRLAEKNGSPRIDFEVVLCMEKK